MQTSTDRILTTHCGSLPRPRALLAPLHAKEARDPYDRDALGKAVRQSVADVVKRQIDVGLDIIGDGEHSKASFSSYARARIGGLEATGKPDTRNAAATRDSLAFPGTYDEMKIMFGARTKAIGKPVGMGALACTGPITYTGAAEVKADIENLKTALGEVPPHEAFITAISTTNLEGYFANEHYRTEDEYLAALADALNVEYRAIVDSGFLLQIDDPRLITHWNRATDMTMEENRRFIAKRVEVINHSLRGIPEDRVRYHTCYSINVAPRVNDLELRHYVDLMLRIKAQAYSIEGSNPRHEHEWKVWEEVKLPPGKVLIPGVVSHCVYQVEHPELVAQRIERFAGVVGRERVIASNDCGFATSAAGDEVHPEVAWAKLEALTVGAEIASRRLWR